MRDWYGEARDWAPGTLRKDVVAHVCGELVFAVQLSASIGLFAVRCAGDDKSYGVSFESYGCSRGCVNVCPLEIFVCAQILLKFYGVHKRSKKKKRFESCMNSTVCG